MGDSGTKDAGNRGWRTCGGVLEPIDRSAPQSRNDHDVRATWFVLLLRIDAGRYGSCEVINLKAPDGTDECWDDSDAWLGSAIIW